MAKLKAHQNTEQASFFDTNNTPETFTDKSFTKNYKELLDYIEQINPNKYAKTRNFIWGAVTYLSPYISRGFISLPQVKKIILSKYKFYESEKLIQELAWREFFQRVWQNQGDAILTDLKHPQQEVKHYKIPESIVNSTTRIDSIDKGIENLYATGYMHNHIRMYTAMLTCNVAKSHWLLPAQWLYYHLLDGDIASNMLSWQWVAGSFSSKKYYANQENISRYTNSKQHSGYLNNSYEAIAEMPIPTELQATTTITLETILPFNKPLQLQSETCLIYNTYNVDSQWHLEEANRILLLEPSHFKQYPISNKVLDWIVELATNNIKDIQVFVGEFSELKKVIDASIPNTTIYYKEHPTTQHYNGVKEERDWMFPEVKGNFSSFFGYWNACEKQLKK